MGLVVAQLHDSKVQFEVLSDSVQLDQCQGSS